MEQEIRFCEASDGVRLAYATHGRGAPLVKAANWLTHVEQDWNSPLWRPWWDELARGHRVVRYDSRGCGLSDREPERLDFEAFVDDLAAVVDAAGLERFALVGMSQGGATAVAYAQRHPERVSHLVLCGAYARGRTARAASADDHSEADLLDHIVRVGWGRPEPAFRRVFTMRLIPDASPVQMCWLDDVMHASASPEMAIRLRRIWAQVDVGDLLGGIATPTLVAHARGDLTIPFEQGRLLATAIPGARLLPLGSRDHILLAGEPAWRTFTDELHRFLGSRQVAPLSTVDTLSARERQVLTLVAQGRTNDEIASELVVSVRTVERHLTNTYAKLRVTGKAGRAAAAVYLSRRNPPPD